eukprot:3660408-Prymnesium_polylepis.2
MDEARRVLRDEEHVCCAMLMFAASVLTPLVGERLLDPKVLCRPKLRTSLVPTRAADAPPRDARPR